MEQKMLKPGERYKSPSGALCQIIGVANYKDTDKTLNIEETKKLVIYQELENDFSLFASPMTTFLNHLQEEGQIEKQEKQNEQKDEPEEKNALIELLEAESYKEKLELLYKMRNSIDRLTMDNLAAALDVTMTGKSLEEDFSLLVDHIQARIRYEGRRLR